MQTIELNKMGLQEMSTGDQQVIEGGGFISFLNGLWDDFVFGLTIGAVVYGAFQLNNSLQWLNPKGGGQNRQLN